MIKVILTVKHVCLRRVKDDVFPIITHYPNLIFTETSESLKLENILITLLKSIKDMGSKEKKIWDSLQS